MTPIDLQRNNQGIVEKVIAGDTCFTIKYTSPDTMGKITHDSLQALMMNLWYDGYLTENPGEIYALTPTAKPVIIDIDYIDGKPLRAIADTWKEAPTLDAAISFLAKKTKHQSLLLAPSTLNWRIGEDSVTPYTNENPYGDLSRVQQEVYTGSLKHPALKPFLGKRFGSRLGNAYEVHYWHNGNHIGENTSSIKPILSSQRRMHSCLFEITTITHRLFREEHDSFIINKGELFFYQILDVGLRYLHYAPTSKKVHEMI